MGLVEEFILPSLTVAAYIIAAGVAWILAKTLLSRVAASETTRTIILSLVSGPIAAGIISYGILQGVIQVQTISPTIIPAFLEPENVSTTLQLLVLAFVLRTAVSDIKIVLPQDIARGPAGRLVLYSIYTLGLIALFRILLTSPLSPGVAENVWIGVNFFTGLFVVYLVTYILDLLIRRYLTIFAEREPGLRTTFSFFRRLLLAAVVLVGVSAVTFSSFPAVGGVISSLFIAAGFASIVIGLAAQSSISNIISGMVVSVFQPFKIGDGLMFRNDFCFVEDVKLVHTVLRTWDNRRLMVPNSVLMSEVIVNYTTVDPTMLAPLLIQISYESDVDKAMKVMREVALGHPNCMPIGDLPNVVIMDYAESGVNLRLLTRAKDQPTAFIMIRDLLYQIKKEFDENGIEIPYPRRQLVLGKDAEGVLDRLIGKLDGGATKKSKKVS